MKKTLLAQLMLASASVLAAASASAVVATATISGGNLGLDANCESNGTDQGFVTWQSASYRQCELPAEILGTGTITLTKKETGTRGKPILWTLPQVVTVGNGQAQNVTPTSVDQPVVAIEAGVQIAGRINNSALVFTRGSKIEANGTDADPIIFSSYDAGYKGKGEWGGLVLSGFGVANECLAGDTCTMEGISNGTFYFGSGSSSVPAGAINSGNVEYVVITEGGSIVDVDTDGDTDPNSNSGDEINGLTLYAVLSGTVINHVHIHDNLDDGVEFFGGDVDVTNLWLTCNRDDSVDWDYGYQGNIKNVKITQFNGADHAFELANNPASAKYTMAPIAGHNATIKNVSIYGVAGNGVFSADAPFKVKEGSEANFINVNIDSIYTNASVCDKVVTGGSATYDNMEFSCTPEIGGALALEGSSSATGFTTNTFWAAAPVCED